jgi:hypothetical protein
MQMGVKCWPLRIIQKTVGLFALVQYKEGKLGISILVQMHPSTYNDEACHGIPTSFNY